MCVGCASRWSRGTGREPGRLAKSRRRRLDFTRYWRKLQRCQKCYGAASGPLNHGGSWVSAALGGQFSARSSWMSVSTVGIIGAGQMGAGVAQVAAQAGVNILLNDVSEEMCRRGLETIERNLDRMVQRGRMKLEERDRLLRRIEITHRLEDLATADFVLEAVVENEDAKIALFQKLDKICPPDVIFASNTSSISITRMAARTSRADRFIGMH